MEKNFTPGSKVWYGPAPDDYDEIRFAGVVTGYNGGMFRVLMCSAYTSWKRPSNQVTIIIAHEDRLHKRSGKTLAVDLSYLKRREKRNDDA